MSRRPPSIAGRLVRRLGILFLIVFFAAGLLPFVIDRDERSEMAAKIMQKDLQRLALAIGVGPDGRIVVNLPLDPGFGYRIIDAQGAVLLDADRAVSQRTLAPEKVEIETARTRIQGPTGSLTIEVATGELSMLDFWRASISEWMTDLLPLLLPILVGTMVIGLRTIGGSFGPLKRMAREAAQISPSAMELRLSDDHLPLELAPLVNSVNAALDRLEEGFRHQREFTADAAHELRTPLAVISAHVDTLVDRKVALALKQDIAAMRRLVDQLLAVAELDAMPLQPPVPTDLVALTGELAAQMAPLALEAGRSIAVLGTEQPVRIDAHPDALWRALRNLVENAIQHAPAGSAVEIEVTPAPATHVRDRGPGISPADRARVTERFWRANRSRVGGAGLGLNIVDRIARAEGGRLIIADRPEGGADIALSFAA
jgi:signal transduction histidine kinase